MRKLLSTITVALCLLALASCQKFEPTAEFLTGTEVGLTVDGQTLLTYDAGTWQYSFKEKAIKYRVFSDDMKDYYSITCSAKPESVGQEIKASVAYAKGGAAPTTASNLKFTVQRTDPEHGIIWLWNTKKGIGMAIFQ